MRFECKEPLKLGYNEIVAADKHPEMMGMEFGVTVLEKCNVAEYNFPQEVIYNLLCGSIIISWEGKKQEIVRADCFHESAKLLHVPQNVKITIECVSDRAEVAIARTENKKVFETRFLNQEDFLCANENRGIGLMNDCSVRLVNTFFDRSSCRETNLFAGEVVHFPGKWSSYPPHKHIEPELYYYRFYPENGYGLAEFGDGAFKVKNNDLLGMPKYITHSQVAAPGYAEYYFWCIRLQDDADIVTNVVDEYKWVAQPDAAYFPGI